MPAAVAAASKVLKEPASVATSTMLGPGGSAGAGAGREGADRSEEGAVGRAKKILHADRVHADGGGDRDLSHIIWGAGADERRRCLKE